MRADRLVVVGLVVGLVLSAIATVAAAVGWWWVVVASSMGLLTGAMVLALDGWRRVRDMRRFLHAELRQLKEVEGPQVRPCASADDVVGTVRALQAQYTGRLDRLQDSVDEVLRRDERS